MGGVAVSSKWTWPQFSASIRDETHLDIVYVMILGLLRDEEIVALLAKLDLSEKVKVGEDPLLAMTRARAKLVREANRAVVVAQKRGALPISFGEAKSCLNHDASMVNAVFLIRALALDPPVPLEDKADLYAAMYGQDDEDDLKRRAIRAKGSLDLAKASASRADAAATLMSAADTTGADLGRLLDLAGVKSSEL